MLTILLMTSNRFDGSHAKIRRAKQHLQQLEAEMGVDSSRQTYTVLVDKDGKTGQDVVEVIIHPWVELRWSVIVGEIVHDLHSALEHSVCSLARIRRPKSECRGSLSFPIYKTKLAPGKKRKELIGVPDAAHAIIEAHQPHAIVGMPPTLHPLWQLKVLSNRDKHRELAFLGRWTWTEYETSVGGKAVTGVSAWREPDLAPDVHTYPDGTRRYRYLVPPIAEVDVKASPPRVYVAFEEPPELLHRPVLLAMRDMTTVSEQVVGALATAFP